MSEGSAALAVQTRQEGDELLLDVRVDNRSATPLYVHHLWSLYPERHTGAHVFHGPGDELVALCGACPPPPGVSAAVPFRLAASRLDAGASLRWSIVLSMPILERGFGQPPDPAAEAEDRVVDRVQLLVDVQAPHPDLRVREFADHGAFDVYGRDPTRIRAQAFLPGPCVVRRRLVFHRVW